MDECESLSHTKWECKYHVVFIPKCRRKTLYVQLRPHLGEVFRKLAVRKQSRIERVLCIQVGGDQEVIREYITKQEEEDARLEQLNLWR